MKKILLLLALFLTGFVPSVYACTTNNDCPGSGVCNVQTGICATPSDPNGTGTGFAAPTTQSTAATPAPTATTPAPAASVSTSNNFIPLTSIPAITSLENSTSNDLSGFFNNIYKICIGVAATLAVLQIIRAGIMYMGGDSITETKQARAMIISSIGGLVLVLSPAVVFGILNPNILSLQIGGNAGLSSLAPPPLGSGSSATQSSTGTSTIWGCSTSAACTNANGTPTSICLNTTTNQYTAWNGKSCSTGFGAGVSCTVQGAGCVQITPFVFSTGSNCPTYTAGQSISVGCESGCTAPNQVVQNIGGKGGETCTAPAGTTPAPPTCSVLTAGLNESATAACCAAQSPRCSMQPYLRSGPYCTCSS